MLTAETQPDAVTVIIPTYRRPVLLRRAIVSVLNQSYSNFTMLVSDNASGDETKAVVMELAASDQRIEYYSHSDNIGMVANFNSALRKVETPFFCFLSDDDVLLPDCLSVGMRCFSQYPEAVFVSGSVIVMDNVGEIWNVPLHYWPRDGVFEPPAGLLYMTTGNHPLITGTIFRKEALRIVGELDPSMVAFDLDYMLRLASTRPFAVSAHPCAVFTMHPGSTGVRSDSWFYWPGFQILLDKLSSNESIPSPIRAKAVDQLTAFLAKGLFYAGIRSTLRSDYSDARRSARILLEYCKANTGAFVLDTVIAIAERWPLGPELLRTVNHVKMALGRLKRKKLNMAFSSYVHDIPKGEDRIVDPE